MWFFIRYCMHRQSTGSHAHDWTKSSRSMANSDCVEVRGLSGHFIQVRDSKAPRGPVLGFTGAEWDTFVNGVRNGEFGPWN